MAEAARFQGTEEVCRATVSRRKKPGGRISSGEERNQATLPATSGAADQSVSPIQALVDSALGSGPRTIDQIVDRLNKSAGHELRKAIPHILVTSNRFKKVGNGWVLAPRRTTLTKKR